MSEELIKALQKTIDKRMVEARAAQEEAIELARVGLSAAMDGSIDENERVTLRAQSSRCRRALDTLDASLARADARPS